MEINLPLNEINEIKKEVIELNDMIDNKCLEIYNKNEENEKKISKYKMYLENIILEHHKICKIIFKK